MPIRVMNPAMAAARRAVAVLWKPQMPTQAMSRAGGAAGASGLAPRMPTLVISLAVAGAMQVCLTPIPVTHRARAAAAAGRPDQVMPTLVIRQVRVAARAHRKSGRNCLQRRVELPSPIRGLFARLIHGFGDTASADQAHV
jgi:hypothetical protein